MSHCGIGSVSDEDVVEHMGDEFKDSAAKASCGLADGGVAATVVTSAVVVN